MTRPAPRARWQAFGAAFTIEALGVGGLLTWWALHPAEPPLRPVPLVIEAAAPAPEPVAPPPPQPAPVPPPPTPQHVVRAEPSPVPPPPAPAPEPAPAPPVLAPTPPTPPAAAVPVAAPAPKPMPPAPAPAGPSPEYQARVKAAAQAAFVYPAAARAVDFKGRTRVGFTLHGTTPLNVHVITPSGMGLVDRAAVHSVESGNYPAPPPELKGIDSYFEIWVDLDMH